MTDLIDKKVIQDALIEKISRLNAEGEKSIQTAREFIRFKRYVDGITPIESTNRPINTPTDLISRHDAIDAICAKAYRHTYLEQIIDIVNALPSADRPKGEWKGYNASDINWLRNDGSPIFLTCDRCNGTVINNGSAHWNYCPNCGAMMER